MVDEQVNMADILLALNNNVYSLNESFKELKKEFEKFPTTIRINDIVITSKLPLKQLEACADRLILKHKDFLLMKKENELKLHAPSYAE